jgi:hypothetical protein
MHLPSPNAMPKAHFKQYKFEIKPSIQSLIGARVVTATKSLADAEAASCASVHMTGQCLL